MKKVIRKNQVIITSLAILIAIAGYLNFADVDLGFGEKEASTESSRFCGAGEAVEGTGAFTEQSRSAGDSEQHRSRG